MEITREDMLRRKVRAAIVNALSVQEDLEYFTVASKLPGISPRVAEGLELKTSNVRAANEVINRAWAEYDAFMKAKAGPQ